MERELQRALSLVSVCLFVLTAGNAAAQEKKERLPASPALPAVKKDCSTCHLPSETAEVGAIKKKLSDLCLDCHSDRKPPAEHKVDIVQPRGVKGLPLTNGMITCFTCHDPHRNPHGRLLRMKATDLCLRCHPM
jgi:predicted CXXCH cytochrome family protein